MNARIVIIEQTDSPTVESELETMIENGTAHGYWTLLDMDVRGDDRENFDGIRERLRVPSSRSSSSDRLKWRTSDERALIVDLLANLCHLIGGEAFDDAVAIAKLHHADESRCSD